jgi:small subunit ribosomal protein S9
MSETHYYEAVGRRKRATARVRLHPGDADGVRVVVNGKPLQEYFGRFQDQEQAVAPLKATQNDSRYNLTVVVQGGGITGQAQAIRQGVARALQIADPDLRKVLRDAGFLTRDPREKERKKVGLKRARKAPQYTKR